MSKNAILSNIKEQQVSPCAMPNIEIEAVIYSNKIAQFIEMNKAVGGAAMEVPAGSDINQFIKELYPDAQRIASNLPEITCATSNPDLLDDPHELNGTDLAIIKASLGVAENASVWIAQNVKHKALYFIAEHLVILLDRNQLVNNMHEAYKQISFNNAPFGIFISGPSKTADIEQALVIGAHGAKGVTVLLT